MFQAKKCSNASPVLEFKDHFVGRSERSDLRRMQKFESHSAGFALLSPPYESLSVFEQCCAIFAFIKHRFWGFINSMNKGHIDSSVDRESLENFGDLNKLQPVVTRQAVIPFFRFWIFKSGPLVRMGVQDLYAENMRIPDMKKRYAQNSWPTIAEHEEYLKMQHEVASHMIAGIKSAIFLTASATVVGVLLAWFAGRLGHSLPFRFDITL